MGLDGALGSRIEGAQGIDLIPKELQAQRRWFCRRPQVQDAAAAGELPGGDHDGGRLIAD